MMHRSWTIAAIAAVSILAAGANSAQARQRHHGFHSQHNYSGYIPRIRINIGGRGGYECGYLYDRWMDTGSRYWRRQFNACRNGY